jgi:predicted porin
MNKKIIAIAVAGAFALPMAAQADVKVYGAAQVEVGSWGGDAAEGISVEDNARGRLGVKASEDLGGGLKGIMKFEFKADTADGDAATGVALTKRELLVGLKGSWGQFEAGRLKSAYKYYGGVKYDQYVATIIEARGNAGMTGGALGHNSFLSDSLAYQGKFGLVSLRVTYDTDNGGGVGGVTTDDTVLSAGVKVGKKNWDAIVAYIDQGADTGGYSSAKIGGSFTFAGAHTIRGQYEAYSTDDGSDATDGTEAYLNYIFKFGKNNLDLGYGINDIKADASDDSTFARVALKHKFSKQTSTWIGYRMYDTDATGGDYSVLSLGLRKDF